jgi:mycothiol synthase
MSSLGARPAREEDLDDVVGLFEAVDLAIGVPFDPVREELVWLWHLPTTDLQRDTRIVKDRDRLIAYVEAIWKHADVDAPLDLTVRVHPDHRDSNIEAALMDWGEGVAGERRTGGVRTAAADRDTLACDLFRSRGYVHVRSHFTMHKEVSPNEDPGTPPGGVTIRPYSDADERSLFDLHEASFAEHWGFHPMSFESFNEELHGEDWDPSLVFLADHQRRAVGYVVPFLFAKAGYVAMLGVLKEWRGRGIGKALLQRSFAEIANRGLPEVRLNVDTENVSGAVELYESVGMNVYRRYDIFDLGTNEAAAANDQR